MSWLFYTIISMLLVWLLSAMGILAYSAWLTMRRKQRASLRARIQEVIHAATAEAGGSEHLNSQPLAATLRALAGKDRESLRDCLIEHSQGMQEDALKPLRDTYEALGFVTDDVRAVISGNWRQKAEAATRLGRMHCASSIEVLTGALRDKDKEVQLAAVCALAEIGDVRSVAAIVYALADADGWHVLQVADKLLQMPADLTRPLLDMLQASGAQRERREAATKMVLELIADFGQRGSERLGSRAARAAASQFLNSEIIDMRARAIRAIAAVGIENNEELEQVMAKLADKEWQVRAVTAKALGQLHQEVAIPELARALSDEAWWVRHNAAHALALLGPRGVEELFSQRLNPDRYARDIAKQVIEELQLDAAIRTEI